MESKNLDFEAFSAPPTFNEFDPLSIAANSTYVVSSPTTTISGTITIPAGVTLNFIGGMLIGTGTLVGNKTKIIASLTQLFGTSLNVSGTWEIDRAYPQWFGAQSEQSINTSSPDSAAAINKAIVMKQTGEVLIPRGWYRVNSSIFVNNAIVLTGEPGIRQGNNVLTDGTVLVPGGSLSNYSGDFLIRNNVNTAGNDWVVSHPTSVTIIKHLNFLNIFNGTKISGLRGILSAGPIVVDTCLWWKFRQAFYELFLYADTRKITRCSFWESENHNLPALYAFDLNSIGDALLFEQNHISYSNGYTQSLRVNICGSGNINANIINSDILIEHSKGITFISNHLEDGAQLMINDSNVTSMNNFFQKGTRPNIVVNSTAENSVPVVKSSGDLFLFYDKKPGTDSTYSVANISEFDVQIGNFINNDIICSLEFSQSYRYWLRTDIIGKMNPHGLALCDKTGNPITDFNEKSYLLSSEGRIMPGNNVINSAYLNNLLDPVIWSLGDNGNVMWNIPSGTYYYKYQILWDRKRLIGGQSNTFSQAFNINSNGLLMMLGNAFLCGNQVMVRFYRGISTNYTQYVDVPITGSTYLYDNGISISGFKWKTLTSSENLTSLNTNITSIRYSGKNIECKAPAAPTAGIGVWQEGDIVFNTSPIIIPNTAHWIFLNGAWYAKP